MEFKCDYIKCHRKPFAEVYPYKTCKKTKEVKFINAWCYLCLVHFIKIKFVEKILRGKIKHAWCLAERSD